MSDNNINVTAPIHAATKKGKLAAAKEVFLEGDTQTVEKEIQDINSRHNDLSSKHKSLSSTVSEHTKQIESNQSQITANKSAQDEKNTSLDANMAKLNTRDDQITELVKGITASGGASVATAVTYDNTSSQLTSATVQGAVDELQDSKIDKASIAQETGESENKVMSQKAVSDKFSDLSVEVDSTTNKTVFSGNAEINSFIKEAYIENWSGGDLYFITINTSDGGENQVSIFINDSENNNIISVYKQPLKDIYIEEKNGVKAYFVIDKCISINYSYHGRYTDSNKITSKAFSLINSPVIKGKFFTDYALDNTDLSTDITSTKLAWKNFIYYKMSNKTNLFASWDRLADKGKGYLYKVEQFIVSLKVYYKYINDEEKVKTYLSNLYISYLNISENGFYFNLNNGNASLAPYLQWILYNTPFCSEKGVGVQSYTLTYYDYTIVATVNWDYYFNTDGTILKSKREIVNYLQSSQSPSSSYDISAELDKKIDKTSIVQTTGTSETSVMSQKAVSEALNNKSFLNVKNVLPNLCNSDSVLKNQNFSKFEISDNKLQIVASGVAGTYFASRRDYNISLKEGHRYCMAYKVLFKDKVLLHNADGLSVVFWAKNTSSDDNNAYTCGIRQPGDIKPTTQEWINVEEPFVAKVDGSIGTIEFRGYNNTKTTDKILDVELSYIMLLDVTELGIDKYQLREFLLQKDSFFEDIQIFKFYPIHQLYYNSKLRSLGDSLPETVSFQPWIANELGMKYSTEFERNTKQIEYNGQSVTSYKSTWGSTRVAPVISSSTNERLMANASIYMRAKSLKYDMPDVLIILAGYNDPKAGSPYIDGGTYVQPADYGINDAPYTGDEIDLVTDKTQTAPSFGASYRGMLEQIIKDNPRCRIILCGVPRGMGEANKFGKEDDWNEGKNKVIEKIAKEYGYPFVNLADLYGVNKFNYEYLTKDNLHFSDFGGKRVAMEILAKAF